MDRKTLLVPLVLILCALFLVLNLFYLQSDGNTRKLSKTLTLTAAPEPTYRKHGSRCTENSCNKVNCNCERIAAFDDLEHPCYGFCMYVSKPTHAPSIFIPIQHWISIVKADFMYQLVHSNSKERTDLIGFGLQTWFKDGFGNILAEYWLSIAYAYFNNYNWIFMHNRSNLFNSSVLNKLQYDKIDKFFDNDKSNIWSKYLPKRYNFVNSTQNELMKAVINNYIDLHNKIGEPRGECDKNIANYFKYPFWHNALFFVINNDFLNNILIPNTQSAMKQMNRMVNYNTNVNFNNMILIHFRCGDLLSKDTGCGYGFYGLSHIKNVLLKWNIYGNSNYDIYFMINLGKSDLKNINQSDIRSVDELYFDKCEILINNLVGYIKNYNGNMYRLFKNHSIFIIDNGTINSDMYYLANAKYVICGYSTFCYYSAFANRNDVSIITSLFVNFQEFKEFAYQRKSDNNSIDNYAKSLTLLSNYALYDMDKMNYLYSWDIYHHRYDIDYIYRWIVNH